MCSNKLKKQSNENVTNFLQRVSRITCNHIMLCYLTLHLKKEHPDERKLGYFALGQGPINGP